MQKCKAYIVPRHALPHIEFMFSMLSLVSILCLYFMFRMLHNKVFKSSPANLKSQYQAISIVDPIDVDSDQLEW